MISIRNLKRHYHKSVSAPGYALTALRKRFKAYLTYWFRDGWSAFPETITIIPTYRCNLRCDMCGQWGKNGASKSYTGEVLRQTLNISRIESLIDEVAPFGPTITLFGGEPLLYEDLERAVSYIKRKGLRCNMVTNGTLLDQKSNTSLAMDLDEIVLSLDGPEEIHDRIRGKHGTFSRLAKGVEKINNLKAQKNQKKPVFQVNSTITNLNCGSMEETVKAAIALKVDTLTFHHLTFISRQTYEDQNRFFASCFGVSCNDWAGFIRCQHPIDDVEHLIKEIRKIKSRNHGIPISFYPNYTEQEIADYYLSSDFHSVSYSNRCFSPWIACYVFPDGSVRPCLSLNYSAGYINERPFREIWNSEKYMDFRRILKESKSFPVCSKCTEYYRF